MTFKLIAGLKFNAFSPSLYDYYGAQVTFDGSAWLVGVDGIWGTREFPTLLAAAEFIAVAFAAAQRDESSG